MSAESPSLTPSAFSFSLLAAHLPNGSTQCVASFRGSHRGAHPAADIIGPIPTPFRTEIKQSIAHPIAGTNLALATKPTEDDLDPHNRLSQSGAKSKCTLLSQHLGA